MTTGNIVKTSSVVHTCNLRDGDQHGRTTASIVTHSRNHGACEKQEPGFYLPDIWNPKEDMTLKAPQQKTNKNQKPKII